MNKLLETYILEYPLEDQVFLLLSIHIRYEQVMQKEKHKII